MSASPDRPLRIALTAPASTQPRRSSPGTWSGRAGRPRRPRPSSASSVLPVCRTRATQAPTHSWIRFEAGAPNEIWRSDFTHWHLADGARSRSSWLDDHSRYLLACSAFRRGCGEMWWPRQRGRRCPRLARGHAHPQRRGLHLALHGGHNGFEYLLAYLGVPRRTTRGQTLRTPGRGRTLPADPQALARGQAASVTNLASLRAQVERLPRQPQQQRASRGNRPQDSARARRTGRSTSTTNQGLDGQGVGSSGLRYDVTDGKGAMTLRRGGRASVPPQGRRCPCPPTRPRHRCRRAVGGGGRPRHPRGDSRPIRRA